MDRYKDIWLVFTIFFVNFTNADIFSDVMRSQDPCKEICSGAQLSLRSTKHIRLICQRGCRFYNLAALKEGTSINDTKKDCHSSCEQSYDRMNDLLTCNAGCDLTAKQKQSEDSSDIWMVYIGQDGVRSNNLLMPQPELDLENELLLSDPVLRNQVEWSYGVEYKIPETHIRTMPIGDNSNAFGIPGIATDQLGGSASENSHRSNDWLDCAARNSGLPRWLLASSIVVAVMVALWICLAPEKRSNLEVAQPFLVNDVQFTPPPKYSLTSDKV